MKRLSFLIVVLNIFLSVSYTLQAEIRMPLIFSDHMVLQREKPIKVWGWADHNELVKVQFNDKLYETKTDKTGRWELYLEALPLGGPYNMQVKGESNELNFNDILMGDVWVCSGQSNMEFLMKNANTAKEDIPRAINSNIRLFYVERRTSYIPLDNFSKGQWLSCAPEVIKDFSAVAYYFGKFVQEETNVPIGLIDCSWGGTEIRTWTSWDTMSKDRVYKKYVNKNQKQIEKIRAKEKIEYERALKNDKGVIEKWYETEVSTDLGWDVINVPDFFEKELPSFDGVVWYQKSIDIPGEMLTGDAVLNLGAIDDKDITFVNGKEVGTNDVFLQNRNYAISANILREGKNIITIKVTDGRGDGGFSGKAEDIYLRIGENKINLSGKWLYRPSLCVYDLDYRDTSFPPNIFASLLFNGMVNPIIQYAIKGAIWYQGEDNVGEAYGYRTLFSTMINDWRKQWGYTFPFYWVQLANFMASSQIPEESAWAELREAQHLTLSLPETGEAVIIDAGDANDVHPTDKKTVGYRLALNALDKTYKKQIVSSGPMYQSMKIESGKIVLSFSNLGSGLLAKGSDKYSYLKGFAIAGENKKFVWAKAYISGDKVVVFHQDIQSPVAVRYAWGNNPEDVNLYNREGLPTSPFRTDDWTLITQR